MLLQPSNITPSTFAGEGYATVAVADPVRITWQVNGTTPMTGFQITIYENSVNSFSPIWNSALISTGAPFYGTDEKGNPVFFTYAPENTAWEDLGLADGREYKIDITQYWGGETDTEHAVSQYAENVFFTRTKPVLSLNIANNTTISSVTKTFLGTYSQAQNDSISSVRWVLSYLENGVSVVVKDTGEINTGMVSYSADGLLNGFSYNISCTVITSSGVSVTASADFSVEYGQQDVPGLKIDGTWLPDEALLLEWSNLETQAANQSGSAVSVSENSLVLGENSSVSWDSSAGKPLNMTLDENDGIYLRAVGTKPLKQTARNTIDRGTCAAFSPSGNLLAVGNSSNTKVYSVSEQGELTEETTLNISPYALSFSQDGNYLLATGGFAGYISLYSVSGTTITLVQNGVAEISASPNCCCPIDSSRFFVGGNGVGYSIIASSSGLTVLDSLTTESASILSCTYGRNALVFGTTDFLGKTSFDSGGKFIATSAISTGTAYNSVKFSADGYLFCKSLTGTIDLFDRSYSSVASYALSASSFALVPSESVEESYSYILVSASNSEGEPIIRVYAQSGAVLTLATESTEADSFVLLEEGPSGLVCGAGAVSSAVYAVFTGIQLFLTILPGSPGLSVRQNGFYFEVLNNGLLIRKVRNAYNAAEVLCNIPEKVSGSKGLFWFFDPDGSWLGFALFESNYGQAFTLPSITKITLEGQSTIRYLMIGSPSANLIYGEYPSSDENTKFITEFSAGSVNAKIRLIGTEPAALYRLDEKNPVLSPVSLPAFISSGRIKDYGLKSARMYSYNLFFKEAGSENQTYTLPVVSSSFCRQFRAYTLLEATEDPDYPTVFHVLNVWRFGCSLSVGQISNNNQPSYLENFTRYPLRQPSRQSPKSGTLTALLGTVSAKGYRDTAEQMERLFEASHSLNSFFLKDMKGNLYRVSISAPIVQEVNIKTKEEQVTVSIPWKEIGSTEGLDLIQLPTDPGWKKDEAEEIKVFVNPETGILTATYPSDYDGSTLYKREAFLYAKTPGGTVPDLFSLEGGVLTVTKP